MQLAVGGLPVWALFTLLIVSAHSDTRPVRAAAIALRLMVTAAALGPLVFRVTERFPWPRPMRTGFVAFHLGASAAYSGTWLLLNSAVESALRGQLAIVIGYGLGSYVIMGIWLYVMTAGVAYASQATERAAHAEVLAARSQLAELRSQLNPHFLFNALHTVVQLIPREPGQASRAAEQLAALLRTATEEGRDIVTVGEEWGFVRRYLDIEALRFGPRLVITSDLPPETLSATVPAFGIQALVENAVRHGAAPRVEPTLVSISGHVADDVLTITVRDTGAGADLGAGFRAGGSGLRRLRDRLRGLYGIGACLDLESVPSGGFTARMVVPQSPNE
jgi:hypothetical protein